MADVCRHLGLTPAEFGTLPAQFAEELLVIHRERAESMVEG